MERVLAVEAMAEFRDGIELLNKSKDLNQAVDVLGGLYGKIVEEEGDLGTGVAPIAFAYGDANLRLAVDANNEFVNAEMKKRAEKEQREAALRAAASGSTGDEENKGPTEDAEGEEDEQVPHISKDDVLELFEIAWECLDTCRVIYERLCLEEQQDPARLKQLHARIAETMLRLGDLKIEQGQFDESIPEFERCLEIRQQEEPEYSRDLATAYHSLGMAHEFAASEKPDLNHRIQAATNFAKALSTLRLSRRKLLNQLEDEQDDQQTGSSKKKAARSRNWVAGLSAEQLGLIDEAFIISSVPLSPPKAASHSAEANELAELITELAGKVDDVTWNFTEEAVAEERAKQLADEEAKMQAVEAEGVDETGFANKPSIAPVAATLLPQSITADVSSSTNGSGAVVINEVQPNVLQPKKKAKLVVPAAQQGDQNQHAHGAF